MTGRFIFKEYKQGFYRLVDTLINMAKKSLGFQFSVILLLITFFAWLSFSDKTFPYSPYNAIIASYRPILLVIVGILAIPPIIAFISQLCSKDKEEFDEKPYYLVLKSIVHLVFSTVIILLLAVFFAYVSVILQLLSVKWLSLILSSILIIGINTLLWRWLSRKFNLKFFGFLSYTKNN